MHKDYIDIEAEDRRLHALAIRRPLIYDDISDVVELLISLKCARFSSIGVYNKDDVAQEIRAKCYRVLPKFDPLAGGIFNFLGRCADNLLLDLRRKHTLRRANVCYRCLFRRDGKCFLFGDQQEKCGRYKTYLENKPKKENVSRMLCDPDFAWGLQPSNTFVFDNENCYESRIRSIRGLLSERMIYPFDMVMANSGVSDDVEEALLDEVRAIIRYDIDW